MIPVVLSGGSGTRLWPVSRASYPKQFCEFYDQSFLQNSLVRLKPFGDPHVVTVGSMKDLTLKTMADCQLDSKNVIFEPMAKNTAPAIALLCFMLSREEVNEDEVVGIFPADHLISLPEKFQEAVELGVEVAKQSEIVTLGIQPRFPATGYGYIEVQDQVVSSHKSFHANKVERFCEKPNSHLAKEFLEAGNYFWNAGMFIFRLGTMIEKLSKLMPETWEDICTIKDDLSNLNYIYANLESQSIDYGVMEKLDSQVCIPCDIGWSDVGSWDELSRLEEEHLDLKINSRADIFLQEAKNNFVYTTKPKIFGLIGVDDLIIVDSSDALLVSKKGKSESVKKIVEEIKSVGRPQATEHDFEFRPWGGFEILSDDKIFKSKKITVEPGQKLSYQSHDKRAEHWIVIQGEAEVTLDDIVNKLKAGEHVYIPKKSKHRIHNIGTQPLIFVEVQIGEYFGEDDIVRYQDDYHRI